LPAAGRPHCWRLNRFFFLRENLKLRLLGARVALLSRDAKSYQGDRGPRWPRWSAIRHCVTAPWVRDRRDAASSCRRRRCKRVPDLAETLEALRKLRLPRTKGPA